MSRRRNPLPTLPPADPKDCYPRYGLEKKKPGARVDICVREKPGKDGQLKSNQCQNTDVMSGNVTPGLRNTLGFPPCCNPDPDPRCIRPEPKKRPAASISNFGYSSNNIILIGAVIVAVIILFYFLYTKKNNKPSDIYQRISQFGRDIKSIKNLKFKG